MLIRAEKEKVFAKSLALLWVAVTGEETGIRICLLPAHESNFGLSLLDDKVNFPLCLIPTRV